MERLKCIAIDDEPLALKLIAKYVAEFPALQLIETFDDALAAQIYLGQTDVDLLFIDINMPDISGIDLVRALEKKPVVIFTTAYKSYAYEGFQLEAVDYIAKPIDFKRFTRAVERAMEYYRYKAHAGEQAGDDFIYVYSEYQMIKIILDEIEYIESMEDYIRIHGPGGKAVLTLMPLKKILEKLPASRFQRIHRSYIVAVQKVKAVHNRKAQLENIELPISDSYASFARNWMKPR